jgi:uncharacterized membrane protein YtjA (UPF0391 family)
LAAGCADSSPDHHLVPVQLIGFGSLREEVAMRWVLAFLIATVTSGILGFGASSPVAGSLGQLMFGLSLIGLLVALMVRAIQRGGPARPFF